MNQTSSNSRTRFGTNLTDVEDKATAQELRDQSPWCDRDYSPTRGERQLLTWITQVADLPGKATFRMALLIRDSAVAYRRKCHLRITSQRTAEAGLSRVAAYEGLRALEGAGLVTVIHCRGRSPLVTILDDDQASKPGA